MLIDAISDRLAEYGVTPTVISTPAQVAVTVEHDGWTLAFTSRGFGIFTTGAWRDGLAAEVQRSEVSGTRAVFYGMAEFARLSGWRKAAA